MIVRSIFVSLKAAAMLAVLFIGIAGAVDRINWVNGDALALGSISSTWISDKSGLNLREMCPHLQPQHIEFKILSDQAIQFRCSWFEGGGLTWWPFYTESDAKSEKATAMFSSIFPLSEPLTTSPSPSLNE